MKKGAVPELSHKWWSKNKGVTVPSTGLGDALKDYEIEKNKSSMDYEIMLARLDTVETVAAKAITKCNKTLHAETIEALKKYPGVIKTERAWINKNYEAYKKKFEDEVSGKTPVQKMGGPVVIFERNLGEQVTKKVGKLKNINFKLGIKIKLTLNDDILDLMEKAQTSSDAAFMAEEANNRCQKLIDDISKLLVDADSKLEKLDEAAGDKLLDKVESGISTMIQVAETEIAKIPKTVWNEFVKREKQYKDYKIKAGLDMTIQVLTVTGGAVATGVSAAGTFGASAVIGVVALVRDCAKLAKMIYDLAIEAETVQKNLQKDINTLEEAYQSKVRNVTQEMVGTVLKSILTIDTPFYATLPKCNTNLELFDNKVAGLETNGRAYSRDVTKALKKCEELEKRLGEMEDKKARKAYDKLVAARKSLDKSLNDCSDMMGRVRKTKPGIVAMGAALKALNDENPKFNKIFDKVLPAAVGIALGGASGGTGFKEASSMLETVNTGVNLGAGMLNELKGILESV
jgi:hypothetical protein